MWQQVLLLLLLDAAVHAAAGTTAVHHEVRDRREAAAGRDQVQSVAMVVHVVSVIHVDDAACVSVHVGHGSMMMVTAAAVHDAVTVADRLMVMPVSLRAHVPLVGCRVVAYAGDADCLRLLLLLLLLLMMMLLLRRRWWQLHRRQPDPVADWITCRALHQESEERHVRAL